MGGRVQLVLPAQASGTDIERSHRAVRFLVLVVPLSAAVKQAARPVNSVALVIDRYHLLYVDVV
jgi:hypothetical protein